MARPLTLIVPLAVAAIPFGLCAATQQEAKAKPVYEGPVQTALKAHCGSCHTGVAARAKLDLTSFEALMKGGASGPAVIPGNAQDSLLVQRLEGRGGLDQMPLGFKPLAPEKIKAIRDWIDAGCKSGGPVVHWAYVVPKLSAVPKVSNPAWVRNPIDAFVLARLDADGLKPSPEASKETLVRRLYLDLTGLPPTPQDVDKFVADQDAKAYEKLVDKLLGTKQYGEKMARSWLDLARYADSDGYEKDLNRTAWKYRDWVIDAFNANMPYDEFTIEQLAGDLLPSPKIEQLVATGFNRNAMFNSEGGVDPGEAQFNVVIDRVNTTSTVWLGSTLQCARCHDHKYDPFSQRDFYKMYTLFDNSEVNKVGDYSKGQEQWIESVIDVPSPAQTARRLALERESGPLDAALKNPDAKTLAAFDRWLKSPDKAGAFTLGSNVTATSLSGQILSKQEDGSFVASGPVPATDVYTVKFRVPTQTVTAFKLSVLADPSFPNRGPGRASSGNFLMTKVEAAVNGKPIELSKATASFTQQGYDAQSAITGKEPGWAIFNAYGQTSELLIEPKAACKVSATDELTVTLRCESKIWPEHVLGRFAVSVTSGAKPTVFTNQVSRMLADTVNLEKNRPALLAEFLKFYPSTRDKATRLVAVTQELNQLKGQVPTAMVMKEKASPVQPGNLHVRGEFGLKGDPVTAGPPDVLGPKPGPETFNRLALARWLVDRGNPLTARVQVNRLWEAFFGMGLVETSEDFGTQGSPPSHPELLDWLAVTFMDKKWDMKAMIRLMVTSSTYRQSSATTRDLIERDPRNMLLARSSRHRLEAETVRDNMLSIAGVLDLKIGGPSVYPIQPPAIWNTPYNGQQWMTSDGSDKYRRGIYTFWKRSTPFPSFLAMDATSRETCTVRRARTNTPLQALALLNDATAMDAAKGLAKRMTTAGKGLDKQLQFGFKACTGRNPGVEELKIVTGLYERLLAKYEAAKPDSDKLGSTPGEAAMVMVANTLLNMDETVTRS